MGRVRCWGEVMMSTTIALLFGLRQEEVINGGCAESMQRTTEMQSQRQVRVERGGGL